MLGDDDGVVIASDAELRVWLPAAEAIQKAEDQVRTRMRMRMLAPQQTGGPLCPSRAPWCAGPRSRTCWHLAAAAVLRVILGRPSARAGALCTMNIVRADTCIARAPTARLGLTVAPKLQEL